MTPAQAIIARITDLEVERRDLLAVADAAQGANQFAPAVSAMGKANAIGAEIADLHATLAGIKIRDPVKRIEHDLVRAESAADWQAVSALFLKLEAAKTKQAAEKQAKLDAEKRAKSPKEKAEMIGDMLVQLPPKLREIALVRMNLDTRREVN